jgi:very-short-patch-repair endonuclease
MGDNVARDQRRDAWLQGRGIHTLRITAADVLDNMEGVIAFIVGRCAERAPPPRAARSPSPRKRGEE